MRHYEIVFMVNPDNSNQVPSMIEKYKESITKDGGYVHRLEDWGRKQLAYPINDHLKAHYVLMNVECTNEALAELEYSFRYNTAVLRKLVIRMNNAVTDKSVMLQEEVKDNADSQESDKA